MEKAGIYIGLLLMVTYVVCIATTTLLLLSVIYVINFPRTYWLPNVIKIMMISKPNTLNFIMKEVTPDCGLMFKVVIR